MRKVIISVGIFVIIVVTVATFKYNDIVYWYNHSVQEEEFVVVESNKYFLKDNYLYVNNYT